MKKLETVPPRALADLEAGLEWIRQSPTHEGTLEWIVRRPKIGQREVLEAAELDVIEGLRGDNWKVRGSYATDDGLAHPDMQLNLMNSRAIELVAQVKDRWPLAGDQLFVDFDLSEDNLPSGTRLSIGTAVIQVTDQPHTGCRKFSARFGKDAVRFVNSRVGKQLRLRGINAKILESGTIRLGDVVRKT